MCGWKKIILLILLPVFRILENHVQFLVHPGFALFKPKYSKIGGIVSKNCHGSVLFWDNQIDSYDIYESRKKFKTKIVLTVSEI